MHRDDEIPRPVSPVIERPSLLLSVVAFAALALMTFLGWMAMTSMPDASPSTHSSLPPDAGANSPIAIALTVVIVTNTPEVTPDPTPEPTYGMLPTPPPLPDICLTSTPKGEVCEQPLAPLPTSTPVLPCPVAPGSVCISQGEQIRWLTPTATATPLTNYGLNS